MDGLLRPSGRQLLVAFALAAGAFFLPQEAALEWYPLNDPSPGTIQLEITCASNVDGSTQIFYDNGPRGHTIDIPMAKSAAAYTYVFPLPDAPLTKLRLDPFFTGPGEFTVARLRLIERHGTELLRFPIAAVSPNGWVKAVEPVGEGWKIVAAADSLDPYVELKLPHPVIPAGMNHRNLQRCLLSTGYLAGMLWLVLLIVLTILHRDAGARALLHPALFLAILALLFAIVGNRGLIRESVESARLASSMAAGAK
jgi:hypothetical protein